MRFALVVILSQLILVIDTTLAFGCHRTKDPRHYHALRSTESIEPVHIHDEHAEAKDNLNQETKNDFYPRRAFLSSTIVASLLVPSVNNNILLSPPAKAADANIEQFIKVTPIAHTFVISSTAGKGGTALVKPLRENDATRFLTNARIVYFFYDGPTDKAVSTIQEVMDLTQKRKDGEGPGVTPGKIALGRLPSSSEDLVASGIEKSIASGSVQGLSIQKSNSLKELNEKISSSGDVIFVPPQKSNGTAGNSKIIAKTATDCGLDVGGAKGGGVISVLINGPTNPLIVVESGYETSTILWYGV